MKQTKPEWQCVEKGCVRPAEKDNERCRWHSIRYYAKYWGHSSMLAVKGGCPDRPEVG